MGLVPQGASGRDPDANIVVQLREDNYGTSPWQGANSPPRMLSRGMKLDGLDQPSMFTNNTLVGGVEVGGRRIIQGGSNGGAVAFRRGGTATVPLSQQFVTGADAINGIALGRPLRSYLFQAPIRLVLQAVGGRFEMCLADADTGIIASGTRNGPSWGADQAVNAGRWTPFYRQINAGALTTGPDSAIPALGNAFTLLGIRYTEGSSPRIEWLINNRVIFAVQGDANMPVFAGGGTNLPGWQPAYVMSQHVGSTLQAGDALYEVRSIG